MSTSCGKPTGIPSSWGFFCRRWLAGHYQTRQEIIGLKDATPAPRTLAARRRVDSAVPPRTAQLMSVASPSEAWRFTLSPRLLLNLEKRWVKNEPSDRTFESHRFYSLETRNKTRNHCFGLGPTSIPPKPITLLSSIYHPQI